MKRVNVLAGHAINAANVRPDQLTASDIQALQELLEHDSHEMRQAAREMYADNDVFYPR
jgi:hypothetical protein